MGHQAASFALDAWAASTSAVTPHPGFVAAILSRAVQCRAGMLSRNRQRTTALRSTSVAATTEAVPPREATISRAFMQG